MTALDIKESKKNNCDYKTRLLATSQLHTHNVLLLYDLCDFCESCFTSSNIYPLIRTSHIAIDMCYVP